MLFKLIPIERIVKKNGFICKSYQDLPGNFMPREIYINTIVGSSQAHWRLHKRAQLSIQVISGSASFLIASDPTRSDISSINLDDSSMMKLLIFPHSWFSFSSTSASKLMLLCMSDILHDPSEIVAL